MSPVDRLIQELSKLPGIGSKTALRLVLHILKQPHEYLRSLSEALLDVANKIRFCSRCFHVTDVDPCSICSNQRRDRRVVCVVEDSADLMAIERSLGFHGIYHVLQGVLSPIDGMGPEKLRVEELVCRVKNEGIQEVVLATNPNVTGDATALYVASLIRPTGVRLTRLAAGIPVGSDIEYVDQMTLSKALESRTLITC